MAGRPMVIVAVFVVAFIPASRSYADSNSDVKEQIAAMLQDGQKLNVEQNQIYQETVNLKSAMDGLKMKDAAVKRADAAIAERGRTLSMEAAAIERDKSSLRAHPTCNGTYEPQEYARRKAWCDAEWAKIHERVRQYNLKVADANQLIVVRNRDQAALSQASLAWTQSAKRLYARNEDYMANRRGWFRKFLTFMTNSSRAFDQLKRMAESSGACANIPGIGEFDQNINGASERAHRCLQVLWDGASRPPARRSGKK